MTPEQMAEAFEKERYESLMKKPWTDLRDTERSTRVAVVVDAFARAGITSLVARLTEKAALGDDAAGYLAQRDAEIARLRAEHAAELARLRDAHDAELVRVRDEAAGALGAVESRLVAAVQNERAAFATELADTDLAHAAALADLRAEHARELDRLRAELVAAAVEDGPADASEATPGASTDPASDAQPADAPGTVSAA